MNNDYKWETIGRCKFYTDGTTCTDIEVIDDAKEISFIYPKIMINRERCQKVFSSVEIMLIGRNVISIAIPNKMFPNIKHVESKSNSFINGKYLIERAGGKLLNVFGQSEDAEIDFTLFNRIGSYAFEGCRATKVSDSEDTGFIRINNNAFFGSGFMNQPFVNGIKCVGSLVVDVDETADEVIMPKTGIQYFPDKFVKCMRLPNIRCIDEVTKKPRKVIIEDKNISHDNEVLFRLHEPGIEEFESRIPRYKTIDGIVYTKDGKTLLKCPRNHPGKVTVPDGVEVIAESAFEDTSITDIVLPDSLREIERRAFFDCSKLKSVDFGHGLERIGDMSHDSKTFESCFSLRELKLPSQMKTIGRGVFKNCGIEKLELNEGLEDIGSNAFLYCKNIKEVTLPDSLKSLGENNFLNAEVVHTKHVLKNLVRAISDVTFNDYNNVCTVALDVDGKLIYLPRHLPIEYVSEAQNIIEQKKDWYYGMLFSMSPDINSKNETAICAYMNGDHNRILDEYVKSRADWIAKYLVDVNKTERLVKFLKTGLVSEMMAKYLIEEYNKRPVLSSDDVIAKAYLLQVIGESEQEKDIESDLEL